jgi:hypothetical protein
MVQLSKGASASVGALFVVQVAMSNHARNRGNLITKISTFDLNTNQGRSAAFRLIALDCLRGARVLHANSANSSGEYILTAHALELAFKAFLAKFGVSDSKLEGRAFRHNLAKLHEESCKLGLSISAAGAQANVQWLGKYHSAPLRYEYDSSLPACDVFFEIVESIVEESR